LTVTTDDRFAAQAVSHPTLPIRARRFQGIGNIRTTRVLARLN
jgi:hypothetical protein